jgi:hypothetical protein
MKLAWLLALLCFPLVVRADDGFAAEGLGGVVTIGKTGLVAMSKEVLEISPSRVSVDFQFNNLTSKDVILPVLFPLPAYTADVPSFAYSGQPHGFRVEIDGKTTPFKTQVRANSCGYMAVSKNCKDVTEALKRIGLSDEQIALFPSSSPFRRAMGRLPAARLNKQQEGLLLAQGLMTNEAYTSDRLPVPTWAVEVTYNWRMKFPAGRPLRVRHDYAPFASGGSTGYISEAALRGDYCADEKTVTAWRALPATGVYSSGAVERTNPGRIVDYVLSSANSWAGPIGDFTLRLKKSRPDEVVATCFPAKFRDVDPTTVEAHLVNFVPAKDLRVIFVRGTDFEFDFLPEAPVFQ